MKYKNMAREHKSAVQCSLNISKSVDLLCKEVAGKCYCSAILSLLIVQEQCQRLHKVCLTMRTGGD